MMLPSTNLIYVWQKIRMYKFESSQNVDVNIKFDLPHKKRTSEYLMNMYLPTSFKCRLPHPDNNKSCFGILQH